MARSKQTGPDTVDEVVFHTYPKLIFAWPVVLAGFLFFPFAHFMTDEAFIGTLGWAYVGILATVLLTMGIDLDRNLSVFWLVIVVAVVLLAALLDTQDIKVLSKTLEWLGATDVKYNKGLGLAVSLLLLPPYALMLFWSRLNHRWRMTHNEFEHYAWGRADDSLARGAKRVRSTYPDWLEFLLLGAGTLIVYSASGRQELRRIPHVPRLRRVRKKINQLLESQQVSIREHDALMDELAAEDEEGNSEREENVRSRDGEASGLGTDKDPL